MAKVVMLTAMAGAGLDLSYGDVYETDDVEADRFVEHKAAREFDEKEDGHKPVKRKQDSETLAEGHFQNEKPKVKKKRTEPTTGNQESTDSSAESSATSGKEGESSAESSPVLADGNPQPIHHADQPGSPAPRPRRR